MDNNETFYIYLFIRKDLSREQQIIQTAHAIHMAGMNQLEKNIIPHAVLIGAENNEELFDISEYISANNIEHEIFFEPDINQYTAIATHPIKGEQQRAIFANFETLKY